MSTPDGSGSAPLNLAWGSGTDRGRVRASNEDSLLARPPVFVVADGMGGHVGGAVASRLVVETFASFDGAPCVANGDIESALQLANRRVLDAASGGREGMGTTVVGLAQVRSAGVDHWLVFNVGDSRAYRLAGGDLEQLSVDHSEAQELVSAGRLTADAARADPRWNVITRAIGSDPAPQPDLWLRPAEAGERLLLCSDGLSTEVSDASIRTCLLAHREPQAAADALIERALDAGGRDNVGVIVIDVLPSAGGASIDERTAPRPSRDG